MNIGSESARIAAVFASETGIVVEDHEVIAYCDDDYARHFGYRSSRELVGKHISQVIAREDQPRLLGFGVMRATDGAAPERYSFRGVRRGGDAFEVGVRVRAVSFEGRCLIASRLDTKGAAITPESLARAYEEHAPTVYGFLLRMLRNEAEAQDVLQETFLQAWRQASRFEDRRGTVAGWLLVIARTRALDRIRASKTRSKYEVEAVRVILRGEERCHSRFDADKAKLALGRLPSEQREAIELAYFGDLSQSEIAATLGVPLGTVKTRIMLGMRKLRDLMNRADALLAFPGSSGVPD